MHVAFFFWHANLDFSGSILVDHDQILFLLLRFEPIREFSFLFFCGFLLFLLIIGFFCFKVESFVFPMRDSHSEKLNKYWAMQPRNLEKLASIDAQLRLLVPAKVSEDDKLVEYDALLLDRFLDILQDLHGEDLKETVKS